MLCIARSRILDYTNIRVHAVRLTTINTREWNLCHETALPNRWDPQHSAREAQNGKHDIAKRDTIPLDSQRDDCVKGVQPWTQQR